MTLETIFYVMAIIFMSVMFVFMIALIAILFYIKNRITQVQRDIQQKINLVSAVGGVGGKAVETAVGKLKEYVEAKTKEKTKKSSSKGGE